MTARARAHRRVRRAGDSCLELGDGALDDVAADEHEDGEDVVFERVELCTAEVRLHAWRLKHKSDVVKAQPSLATCAH